ncbi:MAG: type II toxin-antitoxin system RelE/ParE family toxin [Acidobacteria bacterium]|nr:type II toxin-antitoxin system RelE/ParE family toxin [Acidobacteriota bacterium]MCA1641197.1 type II toxin-antitoxin system RelE/ParE family toxin [Acidobacteriota bacterium]
MADFEISFARSARKELESLDDKFVNRIFPKIVALSRQPRPGGCRKLVGEENLWRIRVGDYRVIYEIDDARRIVDVIAVKHRSKAYD